MIESISFSTFLSYSSADKELECVSRIHQSGQVVPHSKPRRIIMSFITFLYLYMIEMYTRNSNLCWLRPTKIQANQALD